MTVVVNERHMQVLFCYDLSQTNRNRTESFLFVNKVLMLFIWLWKLHHNWFWSECKKLISINVIPLKSRNFFLTRHYYRLSLLWTLNHSPEGVRNKGSWLYKYEKTVIFHLSPAMNKSWPSPRALFRPDWPFWRWNVWNVRLLLKFLLKAITVVHTI